MDTAEQQGIRKLVILNGHGGNTTILLAALRALFAGNPKVFVAMVENCVPYRDQLEQVIEIGGGHASEEETSLALFPERIRTQRPAKAREAELSLLSLKASYVNFIRPGK